MNKRFGFVGLALLVCAGISLAMPAGKTGSWSGVVVDNLCGAKDAAKSSADAGACAKKCVEGMGAKYALYDSASKKVYVLDPQDKAAEHAGHKVNVKGTLDEATETITVTSITMPKASN